MSHRRRRWACIGGLLALLLVVRVAQSLAVPSYAPEGMAQVVIVRIEGDLQAVVRQAVAKAGGLDKVIRPGDTVVVKVNMVLDATADSGMVTDPKVARAVVRLAREAGAAQVMIVEGTAQYGQGDANRDRACTQSAFRNAGYDTNGDMVDDATGAPLVDLNDSGGTDGHDPAKVRQVTVPMGLIRQEYWLPNVVLDADVMISVPVFKNHYNAGVTLGMKNLVGLLPNDIYHGPGNIFGKHSLDHSPVNLDRHIVDLNLARRPDFVVVDGQRGMIDGPVGSQIIEPPMGLILAGRDVVALDTVGALVMGYDPRAIPYLRLGAQSGLGTTDVGHIQVVGVPVAQARRDFPAPYAGSPAVRAEAQPPSVALKTPGGQLWYGLATIGVEAGDNDAVARVELYVDDKLVGQAMGGAYDLKLDTGTYAPGTHTLRALAYDRSLNQAQAVQEVQFAAPTDTALPLAATPMPPTATPVPSTATPAPLGDTPAAPSDTPAPPTDVPMAATATLAPTLPAPTLAAVVVPTLETALQSDEPAKPAAGQGSSIPDWLVCAVGGLLGCLVAAFVGLAVIMVRGKQKCRTGRRLRGS
jgi:uncharacterized protein (DUF362 family)